MNGQRAGVGDEETATDAAVEVGNTAATSDALTVCTQTTLGCKHIQTDSDSSTFSDKIKHNITPISNQWRHQLFVIERPSDSRKICQAAFFLAKKVPVMSVELEWGKRGLVQTLKPRSGT